MSQVLSSGRRVAIGPAQPVVVMASLSPNQDEFQATGPFISGGLQSLASGASLPVTFAEPVDLCTVGVVGMHPVLVEQIVTAPPASGNAQQWCMDGTSILLQFGPGVQIASFVLHNMENVSVDVRVNAVRNGCG